MEFCGVSKLMLQLAGEILQRPLREPLCSLVSSPAAGPFWRHMRAPRGYTWWNRLVPGSQSPAHRCCPTSALCGHQAHSLPTDMPKQAPLAVLWMQKLAAGREQESPGPQ